MIGDMNRLRQILANLIGNAIKFTSRGSVNISVTQVLVSHYLRCELSDHHEETQLLRTLQFAVKDTGIGIPSDRLYRLFQPFSQVEASTTRQYGGTGLGLAISKRLCELMGGTMWVKSSVKEGSTFYFTITAPVNVWGQPTTISISPTQPTTRTYSGLQKQSFVFDPQMAMHHPLRILLAEDNIVNQKVALHILHRMGYQADVANNGLEVISALLQQPYDLVFMDMQMPKMDGIETTRAIEQNCQNGKILFKPRIVAMTANAMQGDREICLAAGMDDYLSKPIHNSELVRVLGECLSVKPSNTVTLSSINMSTLLETASDIGGEDPEFLIELIDSYLDNSQSLLQQLYTSFAQKNFEVMLLTVHTLKSSSSVIGSEYLATLCRELETNLRHQEYEDLDIKINKITDEYANVKSELEHEKYH